MHNSLVLGRSGLWLVAVIIAIIIVVGLFLMPRAAAVEKSVAHFERNPEAFVQQVRENSGAYIEDAGTPIFDNKVVQVALSHMKPAMASQVLGVQTEAKAEKWIEVDLSDQRLTTWEGKTKLEDYPVSTGLPGSPTVQGEFWVWRKVLSQAYRGGSKLNGTYYYLPNVPYSLFFHQGYAIHGAYWHNDFGIRPRSHGCVNMRNEDAKEVYEWATPVMPGGFTAFNAEASNPGTRIVIHE